MVMYLKPFSVMPQNQGDRRSNWECLLTKIMPMTRFEVDHVKDLEYSFIWRV